MRKLRLFNEYLQRILRQHISSLLNNDLRSNHALYTAKYLEQAKFEVCRDLRRLIQQAAPGLQGFVRVDKKRRRGGAQEYVVKDEAYAQVGPVFALLACSLLSGGRSRARRLQEAASPSYWQLNSPSTFLTYSWLMDDLLREHNERFYYLTPQNLKISNDMWVGMVQFRLGQHEVGRCCPVPHAGCSSAHICRRTGCTWA